MNVLPQIPHDIAARLPPFARDCAVTTDAVTGLTVPRKTKYLVLDYHQSTLTAQLKALPRPLPFATLARYTCDLLRVQHLPIMITNETIYVCCRVVLFRAGGEPHDAARCCPPRPQA